MDRTTVNLIILAVVLVLAQVIVFNHICLFGIAIPFVFIYLIIRLPLTIADWQLLTIGFFLGLVIDMFSDTPGMNSLACTILAMSRKYILRLYYNREDDMTDAEPSIKTLGLPVYFRYMTTMVGLYCFLIFFIEGFTYFYLGKMLLKIIFSTLLTSGLILGIDSITTRLREKRL